MIPIGEYMYELPPERIAYHPLAQRDQAKLLVYRNGSIAHSSFDKLLAELPSNSRLIFNNTKVIPARLYFQKESGAEIEIFLLQPLKPSQLVHAAMQATGSVQWQCTIGNLKRWKDGAVLKANLGSATLEARLIDREKGIVELSSNPPTPFAEVIDQFGVTPLPPYIKRSAEESDRTRYQTVYSQEDGAVAAPTAGLHFTEEVLKQLSQAGIPSDFVTLHVGAGTFQPVKVADAAAHEMHAEQITITRKNIENLLLPDRFTIAVGTTSMRTLESLYWFGAGLTINPGNTELKVSQQAPYEWKGEQPSLQTAFKAVLKLLDKSGSDSITGETAIYILPGYRFKVCDGLITNFHQPGSTLLLLIAAFVGNDWKRIYREALANDYRFLSYGDSSLLFRADARP